MSGSSELQRVREVQCSKGSGEMLYEDERQMLKEQRQQTSTTGRDLTFPYSSLFLDVFIIPGEQ